MDKQDPIEQKEGKNEKNIDDHIYFDGIDSLLGVQGRDP